MAADNTVDILIRLRGDAEQKLDSFFKKLQQGSPFLAKLGSTGSAALGVLKKHGDDLTTVFGGLGRGIDFVGGKLNAFALAGIQKLMSLAKYAALAGAAFLGWQLWKGIDFNAELQQANVALSVLYKSQARANEALREFYDFAKRTPFQFGEVVQAARALEAFGLNAQKWLSTAGNLASATGHDIADVARALGQVGAGSPEGMERMRNLGINMMNVPGLKFKSGQLATPREDVLGILKPFLDQKYGGMMERQALTFTGAISTLKDNIDMLRSSLTKPLFDRLTKDLVSLNQWIDKLGESPGWQRFITTFSAGLLKVYNWAKRLVDIFAQTYKATGDLGKSFGAVWEKAWPAIEPLITKAAQAFAKALVEALKIGIGAIWKSGALGKGALLAMGFNALGGAVQGGSALWKMGGAAGRLGKAGLGWMYGGGSAAAGAAGVAGTAVSAAGTAGGAISMAQNAQGMWVPAAEAGRLALTGPALSTGGIVGGAGQAAGGAAAAGWVAKLFGSGGWMAAISRVALPLAIAAAVGSIGAWGIGKYAAAKYGTAETGYKHADQAGYAARMGRAEEKQAKYAELESKITAYIEKGVAAYQRIVAVQQQVIDDGRKFADELKESADAVLERMRSPEQSLENLRGKLAGGPDTLRGRLTESDMKLRRLLELGGIDARAGANVDWEAISEKLTKAVKDRRDAAKEVFSTELQIAEILQKQRQTVLDQNKEFSKRLMGMKPEEIEERKAFTGWARTANLSDLMGLGDKYKSMIAETPALAGRQREMEVEYGKSAAWGYATEMPPDQTQTITDLQQKALAAEKSATDPAVALLGEIATHLKASLEKGLQRISIELKPGRIEALVKMDPEGKLQEGIQQLLADASEKTFAQIDASMAEINKMLAERVDKVKKDIAGESGTSEAGTL